VTGDDFVGSGHRTWRQKVFAIARVLLVVGLSDQCDPAFDAALAGWMARLKRVRFQPAELIDELGVCMAKVRNPNGLTLVEIARDVDADPLPERLGPYLSQHKAYDRLVRICRALGRYNRGGKWPLSGGVAAFLLADAGFEVGRYRAWQMLNTLRVRHILHQEEQGEARKPRPGEFVPSNVWKYIGDDAAGNNEAAGEDEVAGEDECPF
jgi:hypothetical protein